MRIVGVVLFAVAVSPASAQSRLFEDRGTTAGARFGSAIVGVGDLNGDGIPDRVIGVPGRFQLSPSPAIFGRVVALSGLDGAALWNTVGPAIGDFFGTDVADAGDVDNDGVRDVGVAALGDGPLAVGSVHVLSGATGAALRSYVGVADRASVVRGGGDLDGDGKSDLLACNSDGFRVYSGATGAVLLSVTQAQLLPPPPVGFSTWTEVRFTGCFVKDLQGDGFDEIALGVTFGSATQPPLNGWVLLLAGPTGAPISGLPTTVPVPPTGASNFTVGESVADAGDVDGDGVHDLALSYRQWTPLAGPPDFVEVRSGATGQPLWSRSAASTPGGGGAYLASVGDLDGDGRPELAASGVFQAWGSPPPPPSAGWSILDGSTGVPVWSVAGATATDYGPVAAAGDVDLDGTPDVHCCSPVAASTSGGVTVLHVGKVFTFSGVASAPATVASLGGGCGVGVGAPPALALSPPVFGDVVACGLLGAAPGASALLIVDLALGVPLALGAGCVFHPDVAHAASWIVVPWQVDANGAATTNLPVPYFPLLVGLPVTAQAIVIDPSAASGFTLTNAVAATLGY